MKKLIVLSLLGALFITYGCKSRKVLITQSDSTGVTHTVKTADVVTSHKDTGSVQTKQIVLKSDSDDTETDITPTPGTVATVTNGVFTGQAAKITVKSKAKHTEAETTTVNEKKGISDSGHVSTTATKSDSTHVFKKQKAVDSKPDYSWIWWVGGGIVVLIGLGFLYIKFVA